MAMNTTAILILAAGAAIIGGAIFLKPKEDELPPPEADPGITEGERPPGWAGTVVLPPSQIVQVQAAPYMRSVTAI